MSSPSPRAAATRGVDVAILDYGCGNLHSLAKALRCGGAEPRIVDDPAVAATARAVVLPGVGAFGAAAERLRPGVEPLREALGRGLPCLGICLGMQLLFARSDEGAGRGLGVLAGEVRRLRAPRLPHMGWNDVVPERPDPLLAGVEPLVAYFAHSFAAAPERDDDVVAWTTHGGDRFPAVVRRANVWGVQFHPEKSGAAGLRLLRNFLELMVVRPRDAYRDSPALFAQGGVAPSSKYDEGIPSSARLALNEDGSATRSTHRADGPPS